MEMERVCMRIRKIIAFQLALLTLCSFAACGTVNTNKREKELNDEIIWHENIINVLFDEEDKETKDYLNSLVVKDVGEITLKNLTFSLDELIYDSETGLGAYQLTIKSEEEKLSDLVPNLTMFDSFYVLEKDNFRIEIFDGMLPRRSSSYQQENTEYELIQEQPFESYKYEIINDREIQLWCGLYTPNNNLGFSVFIGDLDDEETHKGGSGHIDLPETDNHIEIKVDDENVLGFYISPFGARIDNSWVNNQMLGKIDYSDTIINFSNGENMVLEDIVTGLSGLRGDEPVMYNYKINKNKFIDINEIKSVTIGGKEYIPQ